MRSSEGEFFELELYWRGSVGTLPRDGKAGREAMYPTMTPEMLHGAAQAAMLFFTLVVAVFSAMFLTRA